MVRQVKRKNLTILGIEEGLYHIKVGKALIPSFLLLAFLNCLIFSQRVLVLKQPGIWGKRKNER